MKLFALAASLLLFPTTLFAVEVDIQKGVHANLAKKWVTAILDNETAVMAAMTAFPIHFGEMDIQDKDDLHGMIQSKHFEQLRDFHKKDGWEFAKVIILDGERKKMVAERSFPNLEAEKLVFVFVRIVDDVNGDRKQPVDDSVVAFSPGANPRVVGYGGD